jgi:hypothetical protein
MKINNSLKLLGHPATFVLTLNEEQELQREGREEDNSSDIELELEESRQREVRAKQVLCLAVKEKSSPNIKELLVKLLSIFPGSEEDSEVDSEVEVVENPRNLPRAMDGLLAQAVLVSRAPLKKQKKKAVEKAVKKTPVEKRKKRKKAESEPESEASGGEESEYEEAEDSVEASKTPAKKRPVRAARGAATTAAL